MRYGRSPDSGAFLTAGYTGWPQYYQQFAAQPGITPAAFSAWPAQWNGAAAMSGWPAYGKCTSEDDRALALFGIGEWDC